MENPALKNSFSPLQCSSSVPDEILSEKVELKQPLEGDTALQGQGVSESGFFSISGSLSSCESSCEGQSAIEAISGKEISSSEQVVPCATEDKTQKASGVHPSPETGKDNNEMQ